MLQQAGDPTELKSIVGALGKGRSAANPLIVTSIKGNIGHAEAASGAAGIVKILSMLKAEMIPPQVGLTTLNPKIEALKTDSLVFPLESKPWSRTRGVYPRRALLNNFGAAGSNACLILEEYTGPGAGPGSHGGNASTVDTPFRDSYIFALSTKDKPGFERARQALLRDLQIKHGEQRVSIQHLAYTSLRRAVLDTQLFVVVKSTEELLHVLDNPKIQPRIRSRVDAPRQTRLALVFSGQGSQYIGMGRGLFDTVQSFRTDISYCDTILQSLGRPPILPIIQGQDASMDADMSAMHCALVAIQYALARLWASWGVRPDAVFGHSLGEYAALVAANVLSIRDALAIVSHRASLIEATCGRGESGMVAAKCSSEEMAEILSKQNHQHSPDGVSIACINGPNDCVLAASLAQLGDLESRCQDRGIKTKRLDIDFGFHSPVMDIIKPQLDLFTSTIRLKDPHVDLGLGLYGRMYTKGESISHQYFSAQVASTVRFQEMIEAHQEMSSRDSCNIYLEVGPHPILCPMVKSITQSNDGVMTLGSLNKTKDSWSALAETVAELARIGVPVDWRRGFDDQNARLVDLPLYPFAKDEFMVPHVTHLNKSPGHVPEGLEDQKSQADVRIGSLLSRELSMQRALKRYEYMASSSSIQALIQGHRVAGVSLCPASVYVEMALQAAQHSRRLAASYSVKHISFLTPLIGTENTPVEPIKVIIDDAVGPERSVSFSIANPGGDLDRDAPVSTQFCQGLLEHIPEQQAVFLPEVHRTPSHPDKSTIIRRRMLYETIFSRVVAYSPTYQTIDWLQMSHTGAKAWGSFRLRQGALLAQPCVGQPIFIDTLLHAAGFLANCSVSSADVCICTRINEILVQPQTTEMDYSESFSLFTEISTNRNTITGNSYAYDQSGLQVGYVGGIEFKRMPLESLKRSLHHVSGVPSGPRAKTAQARTGRPRQTERIDPRQASSNHSPELVSGEVIYDLLQILARVAGRSDTEALQMLDFSELGVDSLMMIELIDELKKRFSHLESVSELTLNACHNFSELKNVVVGQGTADGSSTGSGKSSPNSSWNSSRRGSRASIVGTPLTASPSSSATRQNARSGVDSLHVVRSILAELTQSSLDQIKSDTRLDELGLDSLMFIELLDLLASKYQVDFQSSDLEDCKTPREIAQAISLPGQDTMENSDTPQPVLSDTTVQSSPRRPALIQQGTPEAPALYLVHDGSGMSSMYGRLESLGLDVYGIAAEEVKGQDRDVSVQDMARSYAAMIDTTRDVILGGEIFQPKTLIYPS